MKFVLPSQEAADKLRTTTIQVKETRLVPTVETILALMEMISTALWYVCAGAGWGGGGKGL